MGSFADGATIRECYALHHEDDMSLGEIAEEMHISRQAVHDNIERAKASMEGV